MSNIIISNNMGLPIPVPGVDPGPDYAFNLNSSLALVDSHDHSSGKGVQITPSGLSITSDLPMLDNNLTNIRSLRLQSQSGALSLATDLGCLYQNGINLYYNDGNGVQIPITANGGIVGSPGSISNLNSPASASYVAGTETFVWQSAASTPANLDAASIILRNLSLNSKGLTLNPPLAMGSDIIQTLPAIPLSGTSIMQMDTGGNMSASLVTDNSTLGISGNILGVKNNGITSTQIANQTIVAANIANNTITTNQISNSAGITGTQIANTTIAAGNIVNSTITGGKIASATISGSNIANATVANSNLATANTAGTGSSGSFATASQTPVTILGPSILTIVNNRNVLVVVQPASSANSYILAQGPSTCFLTLVRDSSITIATWVLGYTTNIGGGVYLPCGITFIDTLVTTGSHSWTLQGYVSNGGNALSVVNMALLVREL